MGLRLIAELLLLFLLPTILVFAYLHLTRGPRTVTTTLSELPLAWLFLAGAMLMFATLAAFATRGGSAPDAPYVPPVVKIERAQDPKPLTK
ncbi:MAG: hypothetical protein RL291_1234 [Pseudomonadota bacterium]|jgi:hypothetical protein